MLPGGGPGREVVTSRGPYRAGCPPGRGGALKCWGRESLSPFVPAPRPDGARRSGVALGAPLAPAASSLVI